jgi:hypothetical protein
MWHKSKPFSNIAFTRCFARADILHARRTISQQNQATEQLAT